MSEIRHHAVRPSATPNAHDISDVEIFRVGTWNGTRYDEADLDAMVEAFGSLGWKPPIKLGHTEDTSAPAYGWVEGLRRVGDRLVADLAAVPDAMVDQIRERRYDAVSSEIWHGLHVNGRKFDRALSAVALLGAATPGVEGLKPLSQSLAIGKDAYERLATYTLTLTKENAAMPDDPSKDQNKDTKAKKLKASDPVAPADAIDVRQFRALQEQNGELARQIEALSTQLVRFGGVNDRVKELETQLAATQEARRQELVRQKVEAVTIPPFRPFVASMLDLATKHETSLVKFKLSDGKETKEVDLSPVAVIDQFIETINTIGRRIFGEIVASGPAPHQDAARAQKASDEVDRRAKKLLEDGKVKTYGEAMNAVLASDPDLKRRYALRQ